MSARERKRKTIKTVGCKAMPGVGILLEELVGEVQATSRRWARERQVKEEQ